MHAKPIQMKRIFPFALVFIISLSGFAQSGKKEISLEDIWSGSTFSSKSVSGVKSMKDGNHYTTLSRASDDLAIVKYEYKTGKAVDTLLKKSWLVLSDDAKKLLPKADLNFSGYSFNEDHTLILLSTSEEPIYRHSFSAQYYIYNTKTKKTVPLSTGGKQMYATFAPDSARIAFVRENNIFIYDMLKNKETAITVDGMKNEIINGASDWVYEEELELVQAFEWSPDGKRIAFYRFDESKVKEYTMDLYGNASGYPTIERFKYPKAGEVNSTVSIHVYDLSKGSSIKIPVSKDGNNDQYIPRIQFTKDPAFLSIQRMNRKQTELELLIADVRNGQSKVVLTENSDTYIEVTHTLTFLDDKKTFIWDSERDGYNHLYLYSMTGELKNQITKGNWDVTKFYGVQGSQVYYQSTETSAMERYVYTSSIDGKGKKQLGNRKGTNDAQFSKSFKYFINFNSSANIPVFVTLNGSDGSVIRDLEKNEAINERLAEYNLTKKEFFKFKNSEGIELNGWMMKPIGFSESKKYPVLMLVYGGPGINTVNDSWDGKNYMWYQMLCQKGYMVVSVDARGTGGRGVAFKKCTQLNLSKYETIDQIESAKYLGSLPYVDKSRIGIWGWSYGGYMTAMCLTLGADVFKAGISVAPLAHWKFYDSIYTERFMGLPKDNAKGYNEGSPITHADKLKGKFLLVHGTADDNVHFQNSLEIVDAFVKAGKQFETFFYPNKNHSIYGGNTRLHLYTKMTDFIQTNL